MTRYRIVALVLLVSVAVGTVGVSAQTANSDSDTTSQRIDEDVTLISWEYDDERGGFALIFNSSETKKITITEAIQFREGSGSGKIFTERVLPGRTEIFVEVPQRGGQAAVTMTTPDSIEENRYSYVSTGTSKPEREPVDYGTVQLLVAGTAIASVTGSFIIVRRRRQKDEKEVKRVL